jgi:hypothetical protein
LLGGFGSSVKGTGFEEGDGEGVSDFDDMSLSKRRFLTVVINDMKAFSTLTLVFAEHSKKGMWNSSASANP